MHSNTKLNISEIFYSLQGEAKFSGIPTVFIRLIGCPLRCSYCDSEYAFYGNNPKTIDAILKEIRTYQCNYICITGGEPLAHKECNAFIAFLISKGYDVSLETSGALSIRHTPKECHIVMDLKTPSSLEESKNLYDNLSHLKPSDEIKFVIGDRKDFDWSVQKINEYNITNALFSPVYEALLEVTLADWILKEHISVKFQLQLHKHLWGEIAGV